MPLPPNSSLSLLGHSRPGDTVHSRPKQAMIVRMSAETLDALESFSQQPQMDFEFGDNPGIYIGGTFFPMRPLKEDTPHELYLRASSAAKKMAPLKLYANVTGKFTVERQLGEKVTDMLREKTIDAARQRDRKTKFIDTPPDLPATNSRKRKEHPTSSMFRNPVRQSDQSRITSTSSTTAQTRVTSPVPPKRLSKDGSNPLRMRLVHCIAVSERTSDQVVKLVGGSDCDPSLRREILDLLEEVSEPSTPIGKGDDRTAKTWRLKPESWLEVRPYQWPKLTDTEKTNMARNARRMLSSLHVAESDAAWSHVKYRPNNVPDIPAAPSTGAFRENAGTHTGGLKAGAQNAKAGAPKRGVSSKEAKEKRAKPKPDRKAEIQMKDESIRANPRVGGVSGRTKELDSASTSPSNAPAPVRKPPGSGFRVGKSASRDERSDTIEGSSRSPLPRAKPVNARTVTDREPPAASLPASSAPPIPQPTIRERKGGPCAQTQRIKKIRESDAGASASSDRETPGDRARDPGKGRVRAEVDGKKKSKIGIEDAPTLKRKKQTQDGDDYEATISRATSQKKRKTENGAVPAPSRETKLREPTNDSLLPKRQELAPSVQRTARKEASPLPPSLPKIKKDVLPSVKPSVLSRDRKTPPASRSSSSSSALARNQTGVKMNGTSKSRRRSPIYTSTEDEGEIRQPSRRGAPAVPLMAPVTTTDYPASYSKSHPHAHPRTREPRPLPTDHASLRARYGSSYLEYLTTFQMLVAQRGKLDSLLRNSDVGSAGSITDSEGDIELLDPEELSRLSSDYKRLHDELETIRQIFPRSESD